MVVTLNTVLTSAAICSTYSRAFACFRQVAKHLARLRGEAVESSDEEEDGANVAVTGDEESEMAQADDVTSLTSPGLDEGAQLVQLASPQLMQLTAGGGMIGVPLQTAPGQPVMLSQAQAMAIAQAQQAQALRQAQLIQVRPLFINYNEKNAGMCSRLVAKAMTVRR